MSCLMLPLFVSLHFPLLPRPAGNLHKVGDSGCREERGLSLKSSFACGDPSPSSQGPHGERHRGFLPGINGAQEEWVWKQVREHQGWHGCLFWGGVGREPPPQKKAPKQRVTQGRFIRTLRAAFRPFRFSRSLHHLLTSPLPCILIFSHP